MVYILMQQHVFQQACYKAQLEPQLIAWVSQVPVPKCEGALGISQEVKLRYLFSMSFWSPLACCNFSKLSELSVFVSLPCGLLPLVSLLIFPVPGLWAQNKFCCIRLGDSSYLLLPVKAPFLPFVQYKTMPPQKTSVYSKSKCRSLEVFTGI